MECDFGNSDVECLILTIKDHPEIWDFESEDYKDRNKRRNAWEEVCRVFKEEFDELSKAEKDALIRQFIRKWKNLKDAFMKAIRRNQRTGRKEVHRKYLYGKQMNFLLEKVRNDHQSKELPKNRINKSINSKRQNFHKRENVIRKIDKEDSSVEYVAVPMDIPKHQEIDEDTSFFNSILPMVKQFNADQKLDFRSEVLNVIKNMRRMSQMVNSQEHNCSTSTTSFYEESLDIKEDLTQ
ncbi:uncharacterized protein LOC130892694 [Diorhabda carinulata]|uniref:uncharacterized protein LOC130892694 n=1 Tax=Diorhabda carinulata TaxID=1163345 RepID=UPI0025A2BF6A|nr:uncharacterized protein LOC130892694 [Diorhabda carinulata]